MSNSPTNPRRIKIYDGEDPTVQYFGEAAIGTATTDPFWRIMRMTYIGNSFGMQYADGDDEYNNVWDNRYSLEYS